MPARSQRADDAENAAESGALNGLPRARSKENGLFFEYSATFASVNREDMSVSVESAGFPRSKVATRKFSPSLWQVFPVFEGGFFVQTITNTNDYCEKENVYVSDKSHS